MDTNIRPETMERITTPELAAAFIDEQVKIVRDQVGDKNDDRNWLDEISFKEEIKKLSDRERLILSLRYMKGKTQMEVSSQIGISQAQVSRLEKGAICKIKGYS